MFWDSLGKRKIIKFVGSHPSGEAIRCLSRSHIRSDCRGSWFWGSSSIHISSRHNQCGWKWSHFHHSSRHNSTKSSSTKVEKRLIILVIHHEFMHFSSINHPPVFSKQTYSISLIPGEGPELANVVAQDRDGDVLSYSIEPPEYRNLFSIDNHVLIPTYSASMKNQYFRAACLFVFLTLNCNSLCTASSWLPKTMGTRWCPPLWMSNYKCSNRPLDLSQQELLRARLLSLRSDLRPFRLWKGSRGLPLQDRR